MSDQEEVKTEPEAVKPADSVNCEKHGETVYWQAKLGDKSLAKVCFQCWVEKQVEGLAQFE